jgi:hypothetical protein
MAGYVAKQDPLKKSVRAEKVRNPLAPVIAAEKLANLPNREFSILMAESASIDSVRALGLSGLLHAIDSRKHFLTSREVFRITSGLCRLNVVNNQGVIPLITACLSDGRLEQLFAHEIAFMAVQIAACARRLEISGLKREEARKFVEALSDQFVGKLDAASVFDLANMVTAAVDLQVGTDKQMNKIADKCILQIALFKGPDLADILSACSIMGFVHAELFQASVPHLITRMPLLHDVQLLQLLSVAHIISPSIDQALYQKLMSRYMEVLGDPNRTYTDVPREILDEFKKSTATLSLSDQLPAFLHTRITSL